MDLGSSAVGLLGVLFLSHAAFSTIQFRGLLQITEEPFSGPPFNVVAELILGFVLCLYAALTVPGNFQSILPSSPENSMERLASALDCWNQALEIDNVIVKEDDQEDQSLFISV